MYISFIVHIYIPLTFRHIDEYTFLVNIISSGTVYKLFRKQILIETLWRQFHFHSEGTPVAPAAFSSVIQI